MLSPVRLNAALSKIGLVSIHGPWWRIVAFRYLIRKPPEPLYAAGSKVDGARFTPRGGFDSLYLAEDQVTALAEVNALIQLPGGPLPVRTPPCTLFVVDGIITRVLDLTDTKTLAALGTTEQEMTGAWATATNPPTQALAQAAYNLGTIAGIQYGCAKHPGETNVVVFPERLIAPAPDYLNVHDPDGNLRQRIGA